MIDLARLKILLNIDSDDTTEDELLTTLKENAQSRIKAYIQVDPSSDFPVVLDWVADELTVKRFNKLAVEGLQSEGVSGATMTFVLDDLKEFTPVLDNYVRFTGEGGKGRLVML